MSRQARLIFITAALAIIGIALSFTSAFHYAEIKAGIDTTSAFCNINATLNCDAVNKSSWSSFAGISLASWGLFFYTWLLVSCLYCVSPKVRASQAPADILLVLGIFTSLASVALFGVSEFIIGALCLVCIGTYLVNFALLGVALSYRGRSIKERMLSAIDGVVVYCRSLIAHYGIGAFILSWSFLLTSMMVFFLALITPLLQMQWMLDDVGPNPTSQKPPLAGSAANQAFATWNAQPQVTFEIEYTDLTKNDYAQGPRDAAIQVIEYVDFECPACRVVHVLTKPLYEKYSKDVQVVFRNYPLDKACNPYLPHGGHAGSCQIAFFSRCAGEQNRFWDSIDYLMQLEALEAEDLSVVSVTAALEAAVPALGLDSAQFNACMKSDRPATKVGLDIESATALRLDRTPSIWVNGKPVKFTASPEIVLEALFKKILEAKSPDQN